MYKRTSETCMCSHLAWKINLYWKVTRLTQQKKEDKTKQIKSNNIKDGRLTGQDPFSVVLGTRTGGISQTKTAT